jgi:hypothetical protein
MIYDLKIQTEAVLEMQSAFEWYEEQKQGLGFELLDEIENCFKKLKNHPTHYGYINKNFRRIKTKRFPYLLIYETRENSVIINSFFHAKKIK